MKTFDQDQLIQKKEEVQDQLSLPTFGGREKNKTKRKNIDHKNGTIKVANVANVVNYNSQIWFCSPKAWQTKTLRYE